MDTDGSMFARPEQPASDPCVRVFAELALKEIRLGGSDVSCLLSDKGAFSEFMDKVNESVLLGHRQPPAAASVIEDDQVTPAEDDDDEEEKPPSSSFQSAVGRSAMPSSFDAKNNDHFTKPAVSSGGSTPVMPLMQHRGRRAAGPSISPSLAPGGGGSRVRFDLYGEEGHTGESVPEKTHRRKHRGSAAGGEGLDAREEAGKGPLISDLSGPSLLQELRRWRSRAMGEMRNARPPSFPRPPISLQPPPLSSSPPPQGPSPAHRTSPDRLPPAHAPRGADSYAETAARARSSVRCSYEGGVASAARETRTLAELAKGVGGGGGGDDRRSISEATSTATAISEAFGGGQVQNEAEEELPPRQPTSNLESRATAVSSGRQGDRVVPVGGGMVDGREGGARLAGWRRVEEEPLELSLDLSDCSDEKLGHLLERGPRRGSLTESQGGGRQEGGSGGGYQAYGAVYAC